MRTLELDSFGAKGTKNRWFIISGQQLSTTIRKRTFAFAAMTHQSYFQYRLLIIQLTKDIKKSAMTFLDKKVSICCIEIYFQELCNNGKSKIAVVNVMMYHWVMIRLRYLIYEAIHNVLCNCSSNYLDVLYKCNLTPLVSTFPCVRVIINVK